MALVLGAGAMLLVACSSPTFPGTGFVQPYSGSDCKTVLVAGDSIAEGMAPHLRARLAATGRCATVVNRAVGGSSSGDWLSYVGPALDATNPDILVIELIGNEGYTGPSWADPAWLGKNATDALALTDAALARGIKVFWAVPPVGAWYCQWSQLHAQLWPHWASWLRTSLPAVRPVGLADWRTPFGGETYNATFAFPDGPRTLRASDCVHLTQAGDDVAADATVFAIQHEWGAAPPVGSLPAAVPTPTVATQPTTTSTTVEPTTTSSTTATAPTS